MIYTVGPQQKYPSLSEVPWEALQPGDTVRVVGRAEPYREKILLSQSGTPQAPLRLEGVPGPKGERVVIDGEGAFTQPSVPYHWPGMEPLALVLIGRRRGQAYASTPAYWEISGLTLRNANKDAAFSDTQRRVQHYNRAASGLYLMQGDHITVRDCCFERCGNGLFTKPVTRALKVSGCTFRGNGVPGSDRQHHLYAEATTAEYRNLIFEPLAPGAMGTCLKDRSGNTLIQGCRFQAGQKTTRLMDLVDPQEGAQEICKVPEFGRTEVIGNVLLVEAGGAVIHYGGDSGTAKALAQTYRKSKLILRNNRIVVRVDQKTSWNTALLKPDSNEQVIEIAEGNSIRLEPVTATSKPTQFYLSAQFGQLHVVGKNEISSGWQPFLRAGGILQGEQWIKTD